jgi:hypothetical protein
MFNQKPNSAGEFALGSMASRAAARFMAQRKRSEETRFAIILRVPKPDWFPENHGKQRWADGKNCFELFCIDDPDFPSERNADGSSAQ